MNEKLTCWHCKKTLETDRLNFRSSCDHCFQDLHVCVNCKHYSPSKPNSCEILTTDSIIDKEKRNLCEDFSVKNSTNSNKKNIDKLRELFENDFPFKKSFDDLFN